MRTAMACCALAAAWLSQASSQAASLREDFSSNPALRGWSEFGRTNLFAWDADTGALAVTWDSTKANSYFYRPLGTVLTKADDVQVSFDLRLADIAVGVHQGHPFTFELAVGLCNLAEACRTNFLRGTAAQSPDLLEFDYFPDSGFGATISPVIVSDTGQFVPSFTFPLAIEVGAWYHVSLTYAAATQTLTTTLEENGVSVGPIKPVQLGASFNDFHVDTLSISSYNDQGADGSLLAHGWIDNVAAVWPDPPISAIQGDFQGGRRQVRFLSETSWTYTLERSEDGQQWSPASAGTPGTGAELILQDGQTQEAAHAYYRVRADRS